MESGIGGEKGVSNHAGHRSISDKLDQKMGWEGGYKETSGTRGFIHGTYHSSIGLYKGIRGNFEGAGAEFKRAGDQFGRMFK